MVSEKLSRFGGVLRKCWWIQAVKNLKRTNRVESDMAESGDQHRRSQQVLCFCFLMRIHTCHHAERLMPGCRASLHELNTQKWTEFINRKNPDGSRWGRILSAHKAIDYTLNKLGNMLLLAAENKLYSHSLLRFSFRLITQTQQGRQANCSTCSCSHWLSLCFIIICVLPGLVQYINENSLYLSLFKADGERELKFP